jgi:glycosyltransferase involved in cell wall biosynthesis
MVTHLRTLCHWEAQRGIKVTVVAATDFDASAIGSESEPLHDALKPSYGELGPCDVGMDSLDVEPLSEEEAAELRDAVEVPREPPPPFNVYTTDIAASPHPLRDLRAAFAVAKAVAAFRIDLIHGHGLRGAWIAALAGRRARKPFLFTAHNLAPDKSGKLARMALRYVGGRASRIIAVSRAVAESMRPYAPASNIEVIPNGIDLAPFDHPTDRTALLTSVGVSEIPTHVVAAAGRLAPEKGFHVLIEAVPGVLDRFPGAHVVIAGEGPERPRLKAMVEERSLHGQVLLPGRVDDVAGLLSMADVVAIPSLSEGQGIVALEAMAARKPVVASRVGGLEETVKSAVTGLLVKPGDPGELAFALCSFLGDPKAREAMGRAGREVVEKEFTADMMVDRTVAVYRSCVPTA